MPGRPTRRIFLLLPSIISCQGTYTDWFDFGFGNTLSCSRLSVGKSYFALCLWITNLTKIWSSSRSLGFEPSPGRGRIGWFRSSSRSVRISIQSFKRFNFACSSGCCSGVLSDCVRGIDSITGCCSGNDPAPTWPESRGDRRADSGRRLKSSRGRGTASSICCGCCSCSRLDLKWSA